MSGAPDMTPTSLAEAEAPRTGKIIKNGPRVFERWYTKLCIQAEPIVRNRDTKLETGGLF